MFSHSSTRIFKFSSFVTLILLVALIGAIVADAVLSTNSPTAIETTYSDEQNNLGNSITPLKIEFVMDASQTGWAAVTNYGLLGYMRDALSIFAGQSHYIELDAYSYGRGTMTTGTFLELETSTDAKIWTAFDKFEKSFGASWGGDVSYTESIENGISNLLASPMENENEQKVLVFITRSTDVPLHEATEDDLKRIDTLLKDNDISLYIVGLAGDVVDYNLLNKYTDNVIDRVQISDIGDIIIDIFEKEAYSSMNYITEGSSLVPPDGIMPEDGHVITEVNIRLYSINNSFSYDARKVISDMERHIADGTINRAGVITITDTELENNEEKLIYLLNLFEANGQRVYYGVDYVSAKATVYEHSGDSGIFAALHELIGIDITLYAYMATALLVVLLIVPIIYRLVRRKKYTSMI